MESLRLWVTSYFLFQMNFVCQPSTEIFHPLQVEERYAVNSKGESVPIKEVAWGTEDDVPTHLLLQFTSSHGGAYIGSPGNSLWIDNVKLVY